MPAKNYQDRPWFDEVIAKIKWCIFYSQSFHFPVHARQLKIFQAAQVCSLHLGNFITSTKQVVITFSVNPLFSIFASTITKNG